MRGAYVRALKPEAQLAEVARRYALSEGARPFTLCLRCNVLLRPVCELHERFMRCPGCEGVFWPGSHYLRMREALRSAVLEPR